MSNYTRIVRGKASVQRVTPLSAAGQAFFVMNGQMVVFTGTDYLLPHDVSLLSAQFACLYEPLTSGANLLLMASVTGSSLGESPQQAAATLPQRKTLSLGAEFLRRIGQFSGRPKGWDGFDAEPISPRTASKAVTLAEEMLSVADDPFVAPAADGTLLLRWSDGDRAVEVYVEPEGDIVEAVEIASDGVRAVSLQSHADLSSQLKKLKRAS